MIISSLNRQYTQGDIRPDIPLNKAVGGKQIQ